MPTPDQPGDRGSRGIRGKGRRAGLALLLACTVSAQVYEGEQDLQHSDARVATMMIGPERWSTAYPLPGVWAKAQDHHNLTHGQDNPAVKENLRKLDYFHLRQYAQLIEKMDLVEEANGKSLLDNSLVVLGSGLSSGRFHQQVNLPTVIAGGGGRIKTNRHRRYGKGTPISNLWLSIARMHGVNIERHGDSTGPLEDFQA